MEKQPKYPSIIHEVLRRKNWTLEQLAEESGYGYSYLRTLMHSHPSRTSRKMYLLMWVNFLEKDPAWAPKWEGGIILTPVASGKMKRWEWWAIGLIAVFILQLVLELIFNLSE